MKFHDVDTSIFKEEALFEKKEPVMFAISGACSFVHWAGRTGITLNERGIAGVMRLMEIYCLLTDKKGGMEMEGTALTILCTLLGNLAAAVLRETGDLALYGELEVMMDELTEGEWFA